ncbi:MAG: TraV family lipoprotein [Candidatus Omnitrophica bacterium]|nr:TraV family lipoprotein [Candidatus Omnitrophota bacterium]
MRFITLLLAVILLSGCETLQDMDFNKPLIPIPENIETKPKEEKIWVEARTSRIWVNPHVDENGDLVEGHYKNTVLEPGHWVVNGNQGQQN